MGGIFISYRREDCPAHAGRLSDALDARFGEANVFIDVDTIDLGVDFVTKIEQAIAECDVVLALIGDRWLTATDRDGNRRLDRPDDFVRLELTSALARDDVRVIPVFVEDSEMPPAAELPDALAPLARRNGFALSDAKWRSDSAVLLDAIGEVVSPARAPVPERAPEPPAQPAGGQAAVRDTLRGRVLWMAPAVFGLAGVTFIVAGSRVAERRWVTAGVLYLVPILVAITWTSLHAEDHALDTLFVFPWLIAWIASAVHIFLLRPRYLAKLRSA